MHISIELYCGRREDSKILLDGHDITKAVLAEGFEVHADPDNPWVSMVLRPDRLSISGDMLADITKWEPGEPAEGDRDL